MELHGQTDYRAYLRAELERRVAKNARYSLRGFARDLGISPQMLSLVLNGKKGISLDSAVELAARLGLDPAEASLFVDLVSFAQAKTPEAKRLARYRLEERISPRSEPYRTLEVDAFKAISDWHHYAILELSCTHGFNPSPVWIAGRLGIPVGEVRAALERLLRLGLLEDQGGALVKVDGNLSADFGIPAPALRKLARQLLEKAAASLEEQSIAERDITNMTMAIDPARLPEAKRMIADFRRKLCAFLEQGERTEVYAFTPALFRLTSSTRRGDLQ